MGHIDIKIINFYYEPLYSNKFDNLYDIPTNKYNLVKMTQNEIENIA